VIPSFVRVLEVLISLWPFFVLFGIVGLVLLVLAILERARTPPFNPGRP
jgi:hypothetical protein